MPVPLFRTAFLAACPGEVHGSARESNRSIGARTTLTKRETVIEERPRWRAELCDATENRRTLDAFAVPSVETVSRSLS
jgi:hypothetical protein